jgi:autotransporter translocation and assembly factor TamB
MVNLSTIINTKDAQDITLPFRSDLKGGGSFNGTVVGLAENPLISGQVYMRDGSLFDIKFSNMTSNLSYTLNRFDLRNGIADVHKGKVEFQGGFDFIGPKHIFDFDVPMASYTAKIKDISLDDINKTYADSNYLSGNIDGSMVVKGPAYDATVSGNIRIDELKSKDVSLGTVISDYTMRGKTVLLNDFIMRKNGSYLSAKVNLIKNNENTTWFDRKNVFYNVTSKECSIDSTNTQISHIMGETIIPCGFTGTGQMANPALSLHLNLTGKKINNIQIGKGEINGVLQDKKIKIYGRFSPEKINRDIISINGNVDIKDQYPWSLKVNLSEDRYDFLVSDIYRKKIDDFKLNLNGVIRLNGTINSIEGDVLLPSMSIQSFGEKITNFEPINVQIKNENISIKSLTLLNAKDGLRIRGGLVWNKSYNLSITGERSKGGGISLKPFKILSDNIMLIDGRLEPDLNIKGSWNLPEISGSVNIENGTLGLKNIIYYLRAINGKININNNKINLENFSSKIGSGSANLTGIISVDGGHIEEVYLETKLRNIMANLTEGFNMNLDADLIFKGDMLKNDLSGNIIINRAKYTGKFDVQSKAAPSEKSASNNGFEKNTQLNINISGDKNIIIKNELVNTTVSADLLIRGTMSAPNIYGKINTNTGMVYFRNNKFDIKRASIQFDGQDDINPFVETIAATTIRNYNIIMNLSRRAKQLNLSFSSNFELKEVEILSLLTLGDFSGDSKETVKLGAGDASTFLTSELQGMLTDRFKDILGVDRLMIAPSISNDFNSLTAQVSVSKWLIDQKLYVTASSTSNVLNNSIVKIEYILNKNLSLLGDSGKNGAIGGDIKFKVEFR